MQVLIQFVFRLSFGLALGMTCTSPRRVTSGFFRNHAYVLLGLNVLAALTAMTPSAQLTVWLPIAAAVLSYAAAVAWLYEQPRVGTPLLGFVAAVSLVSAWFCQQIPTGDSSVSNFLYRMDPLASGMLLGFTITAMFLGHWYLNTPTMELAPLEKLLRWMAIAVMFRAVVCGIGLAWQLQSAGLSTTQWSLVVLRWAAGIIGVGVLTWMARQTLKIPNTQSATGILYVAVIVSFIGELTGQLLSAEAGHPL